MSFSGTINVGDKVRFTSIESNPIKITVASITGFNSNGILYVHDKDGFGWMLGMNDPTLEVVVDE